LLFEKISYNKGAWNDRFFYHSYKVFGFFAPEGNLILTGFVLPFQNKLRGEHGKPVRKKLRSMEKFAVKNLPNLF